MAWLNPFRRRDENTRTLWGYTFQLTEDHLSEEESRPLKYSYDKLGEECLNILNELEPPTKSENVSTKTEVQDPLKPRRTKPKRDLYNLLESHVQDHPKLQELWTQLNTIPEWVDWDQVWHLSVLCCTN